MFVYWDSYFILLGLVPQGEWELASGIVDNLLYAIEQIGHVPKLHLLQDHVPLALPIAVPHIRYRRGTALPNHGGWLARAVAAAEREYNEYWCAEPHLTKIGRSRYVDQARNGCTSVLDTPHYRALAESGWDNTPRFGPDAAKVVPVDLNAQLYRFEGTYRSGCSGLSSRIEDSRIARHEQVPSLYWVD
jgi:alpha,alpha-trehalase